MIKAQKHTTKRQNTETNKREGNQPTKQPNKQPTKQTNQTNKRFLPLSSAPTQTKQTIKQTNAARAPIS
jgi:hypothetical protein